MTTSAFDFQTTICYRDTIESNLIRYAGKPLSWINGLVNHALICQQKVSFSDEKLQRHFNLKAALAYEYDPLQVQITCETNPLYPDTAFGRYFNYGIIYQNLKPLHFRLRVYEDGVNEVNELRKIADERGNVFDHFHDFDEWTPVENMISCFEYDDIIYR
ncbi:hypothetical protein GCM10027037_12480 [Mucilaginibacter koreensis]